MQRIVTSDLLFRQIFDRNTCTYTYLLADKQTRNAVLIDPVDEHVERDVKLLEEHNLTLTYALNTHAHADHISGTGLLKHRLSGVKSVIGAASHAVADILVEEGDSLSIGPKIKLLVFQTPGHTDGCVSYYLPSIESQFPSCVFTGDTLFIRGCGRTDFQGGSSEKLFTSVREKLFTLPTDTLVFPGHDYKGMTVSTIGEEIEHNPRLGKGKTLADFVDIMDNLKLAYPKMMDKAVPANLNCGISPGV